MSTSLILFILLSSVFILLFMVLKLKINAFIALLITSVYAGIVSGMPVTSIATSIQNGMGGTLGFVATVVGLGAIFGQMLESSGGAESLAHYLIGKFGKDKASWAMVITGFIVAIPVFLDVAFIILIPIVYALSRDTKRSLLFYAIPLLAGLAVTHSFIPPTPGPAAVAEIIDADFGWVVFWGFVIGFPVAVIAGPVWGNYISKKIYLLPPAEFFDSSQVPVEYDKKNFPSFRLVIFIIGIPLLLILANTVTDFLISKHAIEKSTVTDLFVFLGHPFTALILATLIAIYFLCVRRGMGKQKILDLSTKALGPAGIIILITGAGGVLKQILVDSGIGKTLAQSIADSSISPILLAWILAAIIRVAQGSATVAMITAASIMAPVLIEFHLNEPEKGLVLVAIASGATLLSHVNDSGFWLVGRYLGMNEKQTLQSWTIMETIISVSGLILALIAGLFV